jgi:hypothetical protein
MNMYYRLVAGAHIDFFVIRPFVRPSVVSMHNVPASGTVRRTVIALTGVPYSIAIVVCCLIHSNGAICQYPSVHRPRWLMP